MPQCERGHVWLWRIWNMSAEALIEDDRIQVLMLRCLHEVSDFFACVLGDDAINVSFSVDKRQFVLLENILNLQPVCGYASETFKHQLKRNLFEFIDSDISRSSSMNEIGGNNVSSQWRTNRLCPKRSNI